MKNLFLLFIFLMFLTVSGLSQNYNGKNNFLHNNGRHYLFNNPAHSYDVLDYKINTDVRHCFSSPYPKNFNASVIIKFKVDSVLNSINLDAVYSSLGIDSVRLIPNNLILSFQHNQSTNILTITLDRQYNPGENVQVKIYYNHKNVSDNAFYASSGYVFTDFPPQGARKFFPCWDEPYDKATVDITVKVPLTARLGSNGRLNDSLVTGDSIYYHWISRDPVATYLIVITGKTDYNIDILYWHRISNPNDSIPIRFYYAAGQNISPVKNVMNNMTTFYSQKFGEYPFEKGGFAYVPNSAGFPWGGMENQTLITMNGWTESLASHEYAHMWFGDMITCGIWSDVWLNESFATYCEALWLEYKSGYSQYKARINQFASTYQSQNPGWALNNPPMNDLYNYAMVYCKGACVLHMLRYVIGDTLFFNSLKGYAEDTLYKYKYALTDDFINKVSTVSGQNLGWFFNQWVKQPNHPNYQNTYRITYLSPQNYNVKLNMKQTQPNPPFFKMPITLKISFTGSPDSVFRVMNDTNNQEFNFYFSSQPATLVFDPNNDIVIKTGTTTIGIKKSEEIIPASYNLFQNYPNPFNSLTNVKFQILNSGLTTIKIFDISGRELTTLLNEIFEPGEYEFKWDAGELSSGIYFYRMESGKFSDVKRMVLVR